MVGFPRKNVVGFPRKKGLTTLQHSGIIIRVSSSGIIDIVERRKIMEFFEDIVLTSNQLCGCDDHCGSDSWGCDSCSCDNHSK